MCTHYPSCILLVCPMPHLSSFLSSDMGIPTSSVTLMDNTMTSLSSLPALMLVLNPKAGQDILKLLLTKWGAWCKPVIACLFYHKCKIMCRAHRSEVQIPHASMCAHLIPIEEID